MTSYQKYMAERKVLFELLERFSVILQDVQLSDAEKVNRLTLNVLSCKSSLYDLNK